MSITQYITRFNRQETQLILIDTEEESEVKTKGSKLFQSFILLICATAILLSALVLSYSQVGCHE